MKTHRQVIAIVCIAFTFSPNADAEERFSGNANVAGNQAMAAELSLLQGKWEGALEGDKMRQKVTITGNSLDFYRDKDFWFKTKVLLPADKVPKQLHATIKGCPSSQKDSIGEVVRAFFKIENETLTLATIGDDAEETLESFEATKGQGTRYEFRKVKPQKNTIERSQSSVPSESLDLSQPLPKQSQDLSNGLGSLALEGHELHTSLKTRQIDDSIRHLPDGMVPPGNPHISSDSDFVEAIARSGSQSRLGRQGIRSVLYAVYVSGGKELGFYGFEAASAADADQREKALRRIWAYNASLGRAYFHRKDLVLVVIWHDGVTPECWKAVKSSVVERLDAAR